MGGTGGLAAAVTGGGGGGPPPFPFPLPCPFPLCFSMGWAGLGWVGCAAAVASGCLGGAAPRRGLLRAAGA